MILILCYKINNEIRQFNNKLHLTEYYITNRFEDYKIFVKGQSLVIDSDEYEILDSSDFEICLTNGVVLFSKEDVLLYNLEIRF